VVLHAKHSSPFSNVQAISARLWGSGFLPGKHAGVSFRPQGDPVLYLHDAPGIPRELRQNPFDRDDLGEAMRSLPPREVDLSHPAGRKAFDELIGAQAIRRLILFLIAGHVVPTTLP